MKKLLLIALAVLMGTAAFAQYQAQPKVREAFQAKNTNDMPTWGQIGTPFVATDINGNTVDLASILASGQAVVIDYSCTWCGPCWSMHQTGILEAINDMSNVQVIWVEIESNNTTQAIYGNSAGGSTQGNWTVDANGNAITYPIIDDDANRSCLNTCISMYEGYVPSIYFIAPSGYFCSVYGETYGFSSSSTTTQAVANINALFSMAPAPNTVPAVNINGLSSALKGSPATFNAEIVSVDEVTSIEWTFADGTPATATGATATTTWNTLGNHQVSVTVTNTTGSTTATMDVNVFEWNWNDEMAYTNGEFASNIGSSSGITWGAKYPAALMTGRNYLSEVALYTVSDGDYTLDIYQTNAGSMPTSADLIYENTYRLAAANNYVNVPIYDRIQLDDTKDLWVVFTSVASYPAAGADFCGDPNGSWVCWNGEWDYIYNLNAELNYTWMIKTTTSATAPAMNVSINGTSNALTNDPVSFTAAGPAAASYSWDFQGAVNPTATGMTASATWATAGTYTVTLTATMGGETATATQQITITSCDALALPFTCGFEASDNMNCWKFIDADGDGYGWDIETWNGSDYHNNGTNAAASASYINSIGALNPDNWMITPQLIIPAEGATLKYYVGGVDANYYQEHYTIYVSTTGSNTSDFTNNVVASNTVSNVNFTQKSYDLSNYAGQTIRIAFRHHNSADVYWMLIDDLEVVAGQHAGINDITAQVALYPNPTTGVLNVLTEGLQEVSVLDVNGRNVMTTSESVIDMTNLSNGVYFVRVITANGISTQKIVKK